MADYCSRKEGVLSKATLDREDWLEAILTVGFLKGSAIRLRYCDLSRTIRSNYRHQGSDKWCDEIVATKAVQQNEETPLGSGCTNAAHEPVPVGKGGMLAALAGNTPFANLFAVPVPVGKGGCWKSFSLLMFQEHRLLTHMLKFRKLSILSIFQ